jgi:hypothetical protein
VVVLPAGSSSVVVLAVVEQTDPEPVHAVVGLPAGSSSVGVPAVVEQTDPEPVHAVVMPAGSSSVVVPAVVVLAVVVLPAGSSSVGVPAVVVLHQLREDSVQQGVHSLSVVHHLEHHALGLAEPVLLVVSVAEQVPQALLVHH